MSTKTPVMPATRTQPPVPSLAPADFFSAAESRIDQWRQLSAVVRAWQAAANRGSIGDACFTDAVELFGRRLRAALDVRGAVRKLVPIQGAFDAAPFSQGEL